MILRQIAAASAAMLLGLLIFGFAHRAWAAGPYFVDQATEFAVCIDPAEQRGVAISGSTVVWRDKRNGNYDIYGNTLSAGAEFPVCTHPAHQGPPAISGNLVVWDDKRDYGNRDIYGTDLSLGGEFAVCTNTAQQYWPDVSGDTVVWRDFRDDPYYTNVSGDIFGKHLDTGSEFPVCADPLPQAGAAISGQRVIWTELRSGDVNNWDVYGKDLSTGDDFSVCEDAANQIDCCIDGDLAVWENADGTVHGKNLSTGSAFSVGSPGTFKSLGGISGDIVVWQDIRGAAQNSSIYGFDTRTQTEFPIRLIQGSQTTSSPAISGNAVVWEDARNGNWDIYGNYLSYADPALSLGPSGTRLNTTGPGGVVSKAIAFSMSQTADSFVDSLTIDYGDGSSVSVPFSQASSLTFDVTASHAFTLQAGQDTRIYVVSATAYGPTDASSDSDCSSGSVNVAILRSPLAAMSLDGVALASGTTLDVVAGQCLDFDGSQAIGFIEEALVALEGEEVLTTTSASGDADELCQGTLTIPDLAVGEDALLQYCTSNTGAGLNSNTWSATLHVVPEPATIGLLLCGLLPVIWARKARAARLSAQHGARRPVLRTPSVSKGSRR